MAAFGRVQVLASVPGLPPAGLGYGRSDAKPLLLATLSGVSPSSSWRAVHQGASSRVCSLLPDRLFCLMGVTFDLPRDGLRFCSHTLGFRRCEPIFRYFSVLFWLSVMLQVRNLLRGCVHRRCLLVVCVASLRRRACDENCGGGHPKIKVNSILLLLLYGTCKHHCWKKTAGNPKHQSRNRKSGAPSAICMNVLCLEPHLYGY